MKTRIVSVLLILLAIVGTVGAQSPAELILLHTNDMHAQFIPSSSEQGRPQVGGMVALQYFVQKVRAEGKPVLLLDAGDFMTG
ncbi:MAG: bifunctional metallophosphatase/5'-nucleotidase, partial [candidate division KSB1 bacterium]|nr:bifunctional metallophosphatase/5'-nucleotidase [candidate division KSB1 bacterium]